MQTIETKYHGPSNVRGSRISAAASGNKARVILSYDHALNGDANHQAAAAALMAKLNWTGRYIGGHTKTGMVFVNADPGFEYSVQR
jgi:hypothetical protein